MPSNIHTLPKDKNNNAIQNSSGFLLHDGTGAPVNSPVSSSTTDVTLIFPNDALKLNVYLPSNAGRLKQGSNYCTIPAAVWFGISGLPGDSIVIGRPSATTLEFAFEILQ